MFKGNLGLLYDIWVVVKKQPSSFLLLNLKANCFFFVCAKNRNLAFFGLIRRLCSQDEGKIFVQEISATYLAKPQMLPKRICCQNANIAIAQMLPNANVAKTQILQNFSYIWLDFSFIQLGFKIKIQEFGTDFSSCFIKCLGTIKKITKTGGTEFLEVCKLYHRYQNGQNLTEREKKKKNTSHVICHVLHVTFYLSLTPTAKSTATDTPPADSHLMHSRLVCKDQKTQTNSKPQKKSLKGQKPKNVHREAGFPRWHRQTHTHTTHCHRDFGKP